MIFRKIFRHRFACVSLLTIAIIVLTVNYFSKSARDLSLLAKAKEGFLNRISRVEEAELPSINVDIFDEYDNDNVTFADVNSVNYPSEAIQCVVIRETDAMIKTVDTFSDFVFDAEWVKKRNGIWQEDFETRYERLKMDKERPPLKVFILPHSHNDPGWLKTFYGYFEQSTKLIIDTMVKKLIEYGDMRFVWTEISFLDLWWESATAEQRDNFKKLVSEGRLEIMTGGWVMTDEANVHLYAMLDQLIEGHQWVKATLNVTPKTGWSIDPFGQGSTVPHLLAKSGFDGAIIQRIHYNWKEHFARHQQGDFLWKSHWSTPRSSEYTLLTHNMPFDIYSTHHSCGPDPHMCDYFDFEKRPPTINKDNVEHHANVMIQQYAKLASLFTHNVAFVLVGGDFTYSRELEFDQQYAGYKKLIDYINSNSKSKYNGAVVQFGTPHDYFTEIKKRQGDNFPSLVGDFFPYSDIFSSGMPAYWTGYFTTRPHYKFMSRKLEHNLRSTEILFTLVTNKARQSKNQHETFVKESEKNYEKIVEARRNLGLFQHHDAITGTSKLKVMIDYLDRLKKSLNDVLSLQQSAIKFLMHSDAGNFTIFDLEKPTESERAIVDIKSGAEKKIVLLNSLAQDRVEVVSILTNDPHVRVTDSSGNELKFQINPTFDAAKDFEISSDIFEVNVLVRAPAMSLTSLHLSHDLQSGKSVAISCRQCATSEFFKHSALNGKVELKNSHMRLIFNETTGFLSAMKHAQYDEVTQLEIAFGAYQSGMRSSGSYLFKPALQSPEHADIFKQQPAAKIFVSRGEIFSDVTVIRGALLTHTLRIFNTDTYLDEAIAVKNIIDFGEKSKKNDVEMVMRVKTAIDNDNNNAKRELEFFTDVNAFQWQPRRATNKLGVEGNYYPITSSVFIQDDVLRLSLLTTHAQGATSFRKGELEVMLDRRIKYDDGRGMGEGVTDSTRMEHKFWLTLEFFPRETVRDRYQSLSFFANHLATSLNYPINAFSVETPAKLVDVQLFASKLPCDTHVVNLRSLSDSSLNWLPSKSALFILYKYGYECQLSNDAFLKDVCESGNDFGDLQFIRNLKIEKIEKTSLTGLEDEGSIRSFRDDSLDAMEIRSYKVTFS